MTRIPVLDYGYLEYVEHWGSDERVIEVARMSTGKGFLGWEPGPCPTCHGNKDVRVGFDKGGYAACPDCEGKGTIRGDKFLLCYLWEHKHASPFEMAGMVIEVQAPIFVFREWHRHRTQSYNEMSARYTPLPNVNYIPTVERLMVNSKSNKQAGVVAGAAELTEDKAQHFREELTGHYQVQEELYQWALKEGIPKELARIHLPVGRYSRMRASANLRNWLAFLRLRMSPDAQWEIREYAQALHGLLAKQFPRTLALFDKEQIGE